MKISISVMAHPSREKYFDYIKSMVGNVPFSIDTEKKGLILNCFNAWLMYDPDADYHIVLQDDAIICKNFIEKAKGVIFKANSIYGKTMFSFYHANRPSFTEEVNQALLGNGLILKDACHSGLANAIPTDKIEEMLQYFSGDDHPADDMRIWHWLKKSGMKNCIPIPSLIDHRAEPSLHSNNPVNKHVKAYKFIDN